MASASTAVLNLPNTRKLTIIAQDPSVRIGNRILTAEVEVPAEELLPGPCGYRIKVVDYDATNNVLYDAAELELKSGNYLDPFSKQSMQGSTVAAFNRSLLENPKFHAQNAYAIAMRILARFEFSLGRRTAWGSDGHQLNVAPHAFAEANAFYSKEDRGLFLGYFAGSDGRPIYTCLSHDVVAHETTHALLDGIRPRYLEPSSPDQAAFHEGFSDIVALLSIFALKDVVATLLDSGGRSHLIDQKFLTPQALKQSVLFGLADQMGQELSQVRGQALRRSVELKPGMKYMSMTEFLEPHRRGELIVAAMMNAFIEIWVSRLNKIGYLQKGKKDRSLVVEEGARVAGHLLTMSIRALDYCPPTDINFSDYLSALLTIDREVVADDSKYGYRDSLISSFKAYDISVADGTNSDGTWVQCAGQLLYSRSHFDSMLRDKEEVFRFVWENRGPLELSKDGYIEVENVRPCYRIGPDGFILHETVAEYVQILTLNVDELKSALKINPPPEMPGWMRVELFGGGALIFDEYGRLKYQIGNRLENAERQTARLQYLWDSGFYDRPAKDSSRLAELHLARAMA
ncbi:MAG: hypothetical protein ACM3IH_01855 [Sphingobacteriales bacterium]|jgi:hypothetical protein